MIKSNAKRLFIASPVHLYNYDALKRDFNGVIEGKWVEEENLHMTWVFLGDVITLEAVINKLHNITSLDNDIAVAELGFFGYPPRIHFMKAENEMILYNKVKELEVAGFNIYRFKPHITICRIKTIHNYKVYKEMMKKYRKHILGVIKPKIILYESKLSYAGPVYHAIWES